MDSYIILLLITGLAIFGMSWMPLFTKRTGIGFAVVYVLAGAVIFYALPQWLPSADIRRMDMLTLRLSELIVIISLMGTGIKIDRKFSVKAWIIPLRMVLIGMVVTILLVFFAGTAFLGLTWTSALLLAAALSPTDPVLAGDVQVGPPNKSVRSETQFALTAEAGINDGLAFPFVWLAIVGVMATGQVDWIQWAGFYLVLKILTGVFIGVLAGRFLGYLIFRKHIFNSMQVSKEGFMAVALTLLIYAITELAHGYGFVAVFIFAITLRHYEKNSEYHEHLHSFTDQTERILLAVMLLFFGGSLVHSVLGNFTLEVVLFSLALIFVIRPVAILISLIGVKLDLRERIAISFFGIRGMGSVFYLAFAFSVAGFERADFLWTVVSFSIFLSVLIHGLTATRFMRFLRKNSDGSALPA